MKTMFKVMIDVDGFPVLEIIQAHKTISLCRNQITRLPSIFNSLVSRLDYSSKFVLEHITLDEIDVGVTKQYYIESATDDI